jgi:hypothetical protein
VDRLKVKFGLKITTDETTVNDDDTSEPVAAEGDGTAANGDDTELPSVERQASHDSNEQTPTTSTKRNTKPRRT